MKILKYLCNPLQGATSEERLALTNRAFQSCGMPQNATNQTEEIEITQKEIVIWIENLQTDF